MTADKRKALREAVLRLLNENDAGGTENWRDGPGAEGYWIGVAEGEYDATTRAQAAEAEVSRLRSALDEARAVLRQLEWSALDDSAHGEECPVCMTPRHRLKAKRVHAPGCRLAAVLRGDEAPTKSAKP